MCTRTLCTYIHISLVCLRVCMAIGAFFWLLKIPVDLRLAAPSFGSRVARKMRGASSSLQSRTNPSKSSYNYLPDPTSARSRTPGHQFLCDPIPSSVWVGSLRHMLHGFQHLSFKESVHTFQNLLVVKRVSHCLSCSLKSLAVVQLARCPAAPRRPLGRGADSSYVRRAPRFLRPSLRRVVAWLIKSRAQWYSWLKQSSERSSYE